MATTGDTRPSLLLLVASNRRRGAEVFGETLAHSLAADGWHVRFASLAAAADGPTVTAVPLSSATPESLPKLDRGVVAAIRREVRANAPDIVLANGSSTMQYAVAAVRPMRNRPRIVYVSIGEPMWWIRSGRHRLVRSLILKGVDRVFSVSATTAGQLLAELGVPPAKVRIAPTGVPERFFAIEPASPRDDAADDPLRVVFIGNLSVEKGPLAALRAVALASREHRMSVRFLGDGPQRSALLRAVDEAGLLHDVEVLGSVADVAPHLAWADVLLQTSQTEGLPGVSLEAGAARVASVVFDVGGSSETVIDGETGIVVPAGDVSAAADALRRLAADRSLVRKLGDGARDHVRAHFTLAAAVRRYGELLRDELVADRS